MPIKSAQQFVSIWNYEKAKSSDDDRFWDEESEIDVDTFKEADLKAALKHLQGAVCSPKFPTDPEHPGVSLASRAVDWLCDKIDDSVGKKKLWDDCTTFFMACMAAGPSLGQIVIMQKIANDGLTCDFFEQLSGSKLTKFLECIKKKFVNNRKAPPEDYCSELSTLVASEVIRQFSEEQTAKHRGEFMKLFMFYLSQVPEADEHMAKMYYSELVHSVEYITDDDRWKGLEKIEPDPAKFFLQEQLKTIGNVLKSKKYPAFEDQGDLFESCIKNILNPIRENKTYFSICLDDVMQLFGTVCKLSPGEEKKTLLDTFVSSFFDEMENSEELVSKKQELFKKCLPAMGKLATEIPHPNSMTEALESLLKYFLVDNGNESKKCFNNCLEDVMQLFCTVCKLPAGEAQKELMAPLVSFLEDLEDHKDLVTKKPELFKKYMPMMTKLMPEIPHPDSMGKEALTNLVNYFLLPAGGENPSQAKPWISFMAAVLTQPDTRYISFCKDFMSDHKKMFNWKENIDGAREILKTIGSVKFREDAGDDAEPDDVGSELGDLAEELMNGLKSSKVIGDVQKDVISMVQQIVEGGDQHKLHIASECAEFIELKADRTMALPLMKTFEKQFKNKNFPWSHVCCIGLVSDTFSKILDAHKDSEQISPYSPSFVSIFKSSMNREFYDEDTESDTVFGFVLQSVLLRYASLFRSSKNQDDLKPLLGDMVKLLKCDHEDIASSMGHTFTLLSQLNAVIFAPHLKDILDALLQNEDSTLLSVVQAGYKDNPKPVEDKFDKVFGLLESIEPHYQSSVLMLLKDIADRNPKLFTKKHIEKLLDEYLDNQMTEGIVLQILQALAKKCPEKLEPYIDRLFQQTKTTSGAAFIPNLMVSLVHKNKKLAKPIHDKLIEYVKSCKDFTYIGIALYALRSIGIEDRELLKPHKKLFEDIAKKDANQKDVCKNLIDIIEGKSFEDITEKVEQHDEDINVLDSRVTNTENDVNEIGQEVDSQGKQVGRLKEDVAKQEERIDEIEEVVDDTVEKVEEIDKKTLSNAPAWSRDVSILLNPEAEHDWRLLAQRLGYTPEDIRGWATQHDPCMSLLSEWFATHKTSEATKAVLKTLEEMNRLDAAEIVGRAMQAVENVVQDEPPDYETPPPVFISYQWAHQPEVRLFRKHLEMAGFESWMDIGQMGGGDKLYAKIDQGIRAAQVVICCVTEKYAQSPNCNREVNLAVNLGKPIIPLLLENVAWPPPGAMGPIFGEYLYIRFFQGRPEDDTKDERVWPATSFQELLMQLSYLKLIPEQSKIKKQYKNWWLPPEEVIVVKKKGNDKKTSQGTAKSEENKESGPQPEVFISYQWGMQPQVKALYKRMCGLGYHCWMDIHQMGGGDSLYDKIDRGVRGSKVVLSCVTEKYSKSANCRREVSLADALKKPIIPLLLDDTVWPPSGPMSMVFTQLLYIDFKDEKVQKSWAGQSFDELLGKIKMYMSGSESKAGKVNEVKQTKPAATPEQGKADPKPVAKIQPVANPQPAPENAPRSKTPQGEKKSKSCNII